MITAGSWRDATRWLVPTWGLFAAIHIVLISLDRRTYFVYRESQRETWHHPTGMVVAIVLLTLIEAAVVHYSLELNSMIPSRARVASVLLYLIAWAWILTNGVMHAPGFCIFHVAWVWLLAGVLLIVWTVWLLVAGISRLRAMRDARSHAQQPV